MKQEINNLTVEQIGQIFPVEIVPYRDEWQTLFETEKNLIVSIFMDSFETINVEHFGSTSVKGLSAKPVIDILIEFPILTNETKIAISAKMHESGYENMISAEQEKRMTFGKGYDMQNPEKQKFHVHIREKGNCLQDEIYFRNCLRQNADLQKKYEILKIDLAKKYRNNREDYTSAKTDFITAITKTAKNACKLKTENLQFENT